MSVNARLARGFIFGGVTTERTATDNCTDLASSNPNNRRYCKRAPPFRSLYKASAAYRLPYDVQIAGTFQARPGIPIGAEYTVNSAIAGRPLTGGISSITLDLMDPTRTFYDYVYTNDFRVSRMVRIGRMRVQGFMEVFNFLNDSTIFTRNETFGSQFYQPIALVESRRFQFGVQVDF